MILIELIVVISYCMREMLDKIPEGDWLCEDCKFEERKAQEKAKHNTVDGDEPDGIHRSPGENVGLCEKLNGLDTDVDSIKAETDSSHVKLSRKRKADDAEVSSVAKRQVLESTVRSPRTSSPRRVDVPSRDSSFKNLDRGKVKPAHQVPTKTGNTATQVGGPLDAQLHTSRGTLNPLVSLFILYALMFCFSLGQCLLKQLILQAIFSSLNHLVPQVQNQKLSL